MSRTLPKAIGVRRRMEDDNREARMLKSRGRHSGRASRRKEKDGGVGGGGEGEERVGGEEEFAGRDACEIMRDFLTEMENLEREWSGSGSREGRRRPWERNGRGEWVGIKSIVRKGGSRRGWM